MKEFSKDENKFNEQCKKLFNLINEGLIDEKIVGIFLKREDNLIYFNGVQQDKNTIEMISNDDLKKIYELMKSIYGKNILTGYEHDFYHKFALSITIEENIFLLISSDDAYDQEWFKEKIQLLINKTSNEQKKK